MNVRWVKMNYKELQPDCEKCFGLCCVALYFSSINGFPINKDVGKTCINLACDFKCKVHENLNEKGLKGYIVYDCIGAGQKVAQVTYSGHDWKEKSGHSKEMFNVFINMKQLYEMLWYLNESIRLQDNNINKDKLIKKINEIENLTHLEAKSIINLDLTSIKVGVNALLLQTSEFLRKKVNNGKNTIKGKKALGRTLNLMGADLRKRYLRGINLSGAFLIAANLRGVDLSFTDLIGSDLRDADLSGANLSNSIFITQAQINSAKGDANTRLPKSITRPRHW
jgi:Pentapeptide repeats (8 copies)